MLEQVRDLESVDSGISDLRDIFAILDDLLDSGECSGYAKQYCAVASAAMTSAEAIRAKLQQVIAQLTAEAKAGAA